MTSSPLLDLSELDGDFLNVPFTSAEQMGDFSCDFFYHFFEEQQLSERPLLADSSSLLHLQLDPDIQCEHSYSLSEDSAPQSPALSIKMDQDSEFIFDLSDILVKEEEPDGRLILDSSHQEVPSIEKVIKDEPQPCLCLSKDDGLLLPPTPPRSNHGGSYHGDSNHSSSNHSSSNHGSSNHGESNHGSSNHGDSNHSSSNHGSSNHGSSNHGSGNHGSSNHGSSNHGSDSDGSLPPSSPALPLLPASPEQQRLIGRMSSSSAISSSPLLTAPHKLQGSGPLLLTEEERRTLLAEGFPVPSQLPLSKSEEKALKRVRRKIKNKISAQESRRKKKEYVECLEKKVENYTSENIDLWTKVENLETANRSLLQQLHKLQSLVSGKVSLYRMTSTQTPGTCFMMVALCFMILLGSFCPCLPPLTPPTSPGDAPFPPLADVYRHNQVPSRSLLFYDDGSPLDDSLVTSQGEEHQTTSLSHNRYHGDGHSNHTAHSNLRADQGMEYF